ncbi:tetratricopeptide repeat protein [Capilliphycus salinus ALCB114379]|uniref:tetratricopeptide repeat protein n=1 Tax=Capilliphycus salinus TaxID=2768948 RepID=UPI0039A53DAB
MIYDRLGQDQKAIEFHQQSLAIAQELGFRPGIATSLNNLGIAYEGLGQYQKAIEFHRQSLMVKQELGDRAEIAASLNNLGSAYYNLGQYQQALEFHEKSLVINREIGGCQACSLNNLGAAYEGLGQYQKALESYLESLVISKKIGNLGMEALTLQNIGYLLEKQNQPKLAIALLKQSVNATESIRYERLQNLPRELQQSYIDSISGRYRRLADLLLKENRVLEAQRVLDLLKVQELEDYLKNVRGNANTAGGIEFYQPEQEILARYNKLQQNVIEIGKELTQLQQKENLTPSEQQRRDQLDKILTEVKQQFNEFSLIPKVTNQQQ